MLGLVRFIQVKQGGEMSSNKDISDRGLINLYIRLLRQNRIKRRGAAYERLSYLLQTVHNKEGK